MKNSSAEIRKVIGNRATDKQRAAANPYKSVWVEASAGTGKTKVLSDRVLRLLLSGVNPLKILCLTYTKAAAVEMSSRVAGRLSRWAVCEAGILEKELVELLGEMPSERKEYEKIVNTARRLFAVFLDTPGGMKIQTIHGFCQEVLKRFPLEAGVSPYFKVMDERSSREALKEIQNKVLLKIEREPMSEEAKALGFLTSNVMERNFPKLLEAVAFERNQISRILAGGTDWERELYERLGVSFKDDVSVLQSEFVKNIDRDVARQTMQALYKGSPKQDFGKAEKLRSFLEQGDFEAYAKAINNKQAMNKKVVEAMPEIALYLEKEREKLAALEEKILAVGLAASTRAVMHLAKDMIAGYNNFKKKNCRMDYEDLIVLARGLLENKNVSDWVLFKLDGGIDHVLIDEAQDTSPDQWAIVLSIVNEFFSGAGTKMQARTVFAVGDRKQSIYSFQGADISEFEKNRNKFLEFENFEEVSLDVSFRSTAAVLGAVDKIFDGATEHVSFRAGDAGKVEIWPLFEEDKEDDIGEFFPKAAVKKVSASAKLAREIALKIKQMVEGKELLISQNRPLRYRDFLILVQQRAGLVTELVRECKNLNVAVAGVDKITLLEQIAVQDLISLGKFLLLPTDDLSLAEALKTPIFALGDDDLFELCFDRGGRTLWSRLGENKKYLGIYAKLQELLNMADFVRPFELFSHVLNQFKGRRAYLERMGEEVLDGLDEFINLTLEFEKEHIPSLQGFMGWIAQDKIEIKRELEQSELDAVRIMTVHGSKGLQAPIVILPDTIRQAPSKREAKFLWDDMFYYPLSAGAYNKHCEDIHERNKQLAEEEHQRLLYVALTRAEDRLVVCGYKKKKSKVENSWYEKVSSRVPKEGVECAQEFFAESKKEEESEVLSLPPFEWIYEAAKQEGALAKPYAPSKPEEDEEEEIFISPLTKDKQNRYLRGNVIHKILQFLPEVKNTDAIDAFLATTDLSEAQREKIKKEVWNLREKFAVLFGHNSKAEVPIMGKVGDKIISGQIDRLVVKDDAVMIIDYKTNRPAADFLSEVPLKYLKQMECYKKLIAQIYPSKTIEVYILWTDTLNLMQIPL